MISQKEDKQNQLFNYLTFSIYTVDKLVNNEYQSLKIMNIHILKSNALKCRDNLLGKVQNTQQNLTYLKDLESWGSLEIIDSSKAYIKYRLI